MGSTTSEALKRFSALDDLKFIIKSIRGTITDLGLIIWGLRRSLRNTSSEAESIMAPKAPAGWLDYDDFATGIDTNRLPRTDELAQKDLRIELNNGRSFTLKFIARNRVFVSDGATGSEEWGEAVKVADDTFFIDMTRYARPNESETLIVNTLTKQVLSVTSKIRAETEVLGEPRVLQEWIPGALSGKPKTGMVPHETRDLIGLRAHYTYSPEHVYEHTYLSSTNYCWQNLIGAARGHADVDPATSFKFAHNQYVFGFREFIMPVCSVLFFNWDQFRSTGKFFGEMRNGSIENTPAGALMEMKSKLFYNNGPAPV